MSTIAKSLIVIATMGVSIAHAGFIVDAIASHQARKAAAAPAIASAASTSASASADGRAGLAAVMDVAQRTHAAAQGVVNGHLSNRNKCSELVHQGKLPPTATAQLRCIALGPAVTLGETTTPSPSVRR